MASFKSQIITQASGSVGGLTYSHNKGGMYMRARSIPTNPATAAQVIARNALASMAGRWSTILTQAQRDAWAVYAANVPIIGKLGDPILLSGQQHYIRSNTFRARVDPGNLNLPLVDDAPTVFNIGETGEAAITGNTVGNTLSISFTPGVEWAGADDAACAVFAARPQDVSINFFKGPYQFAGFQEGNTAIPETPPFTVTSPFTHVVGQKLFVYVRATQADGRLSGIGFSSFIAT
jgi:hypothetical protein